jgi:hypothetical protein
MEEAALLLRDPPEYAPSDFAGSFFDASGGIHVFPPDTN